MKRMASVSLVALAMAAGGCTAATEPSANGGAGGEVKATPSTSALTAMLPPGMPALGTTGAPHKVKPEAITLGTRWVALFNTYATYNNGSEWAQPYPFYSFPFPSPWLVPFAQTGNTNVVADLPAWVYEHDELAPILGSNSLPAYEPYQFLVAEFNLGNCYLPGGAVTAVSPAPCVGTFLTGAYFMVPFTDTTAEQAMLQAEQSYWGQSSDVQAFPAYHPFIYEAVVGPNGYVFVPGTDGQEHLMVSGPVAAYPYADVHDPKVPPN